MNTLDTQCRAALANPTHQQAIEYCGRWFTWGEVSATSAAVCGLLAAVGIGAGAAIAFAPRNRPSAIAAQLGLIGQRHGIRMIYAFQSPTGIARDLASLHVDAIVAAAEDFTPEVQRVMQEQGLAGVALHDMGATAAPGGVFTRTDRARVAAAEPHIAVHTSGTTGPPKHVALSYDMIAKHIIGQNVSTVIGAQSQSPPVLLTFPLGNISGIYSTLPSLLAGRRAVLLDRFTLAAWRDYVRRFQPPAPMLPPAAVRMALDAGIPKEELACIKVIQTGAAPLDPGIQRAFETRYGIPILLSYGATEFGGPVTAMTPELYDKFGAAKLGTVGRPFAGARLRAVDPNTGVELSAGQEGLLEVVAPRIGDHWIRTTDIGAIDEDGFVFIRGRSDGAIVRGGFKLLPETIERAICLHPLVAEAAVVGLPDARLGQTPAGAVRIKPGEKQPSIAELEAHLRQHVYATHIPTMWRFVDALPHNRSLKIDRAGVAALFVD